MKHSSAASIRRSIALVIVSLIALGCSPTITPPQVTLSPTQASVTAETAPVQVARTDRSETDLAQNQTVTIAVDDQIRVPEGGHARLNVGKGLETHVYRGSTLSLSEARSEAGDSLFARLKETSGCGKILLAEAAKVRARLETDFASITTLQPGTQFVVCHDLDVLTCLVVLQGEVEVLAQGKVVRLAGGEATFILKDMPPFSPVCARLGEVGAWMGEKEGTGQVEGLDDLVASWPQQSCAAATASAVAAVATGTPAAGDTPVPLPAGDGMVKIPAGAYTVGYTGAYDSHVPPMQKQLPAFWIDAREVTNGQYQSFLYATSRATPTAYVKGKDYPVAGVTWDDAAAFCAWANKRLPTEVEWEVAARGPGPKPPRYPWGDDPLDGGKVDSLPLTETYQVGSIPFNVSPFGVFDMAGNVWEWVGDPYYPVAEGMKVLRGGRYGLIEDMAYRQQAEPADPRFVPVAGFRCAADKVQGQ